MADLGFSWAAAEARGFCDLSNIKIKLKPAMAKSYCIGLGVHKETIVIAYAADCKIALGVGAPSSGFRSTRHPVHHG